MATLPHGSVEELLQRLPQHIGLLQPRIPVVDLRRQPLVLGPQLGHLVGVPLNRGLQRTRQRLRERLPRHLIRGIERLPHPRSRQQRPRRVVHLLRVRGLEGEAPPPGALLRERQRVVRRPVPDHEPPDPLRVVGRHMPGPDRTREVDDPEPDTPVVHPLLIDLRPRLVVLLVEHHLPADRQVGEFFHVRESHSPPPCCRYCSCSHSIRWANWWRSISRTSGVGGVPSPTSANASATNSGKVPSRSAIIANSLRIWSSRAISAASNSSRASAYWSCVACHWSRTSLMVLIP